MELNLNKKTQINQTFDPFSWSFTHKVHTDKLSSDIFSSFQIETRTNTDEYLSSPTLDSWSDSVKLQEELC